MDSYVVHLIIARHKSPELRQLLKHNQDIVEAQKLLIKLKRIIKEKWKKSQ